MKNFRKPYLAMIMATVFLFVSCNQDDNITPVSVESMVVEHLELTKKLATIYLNQDSEISLENLSNFHENKEKFREELINNKLENVEEIISLTNKIQENINMYLITNEYKSEVEQNRIIDDITNEVFRQNRNNIKPVKYQGRSCYSAYGVADQNCLENYALSMAGVSVSTFFTLGIGTVIGGVVATGIMVKCHSDAASAYTDCLDNEN